MFCCETLQVSCVDDTGRIKASPTLFWTHQPSRSRDRDLRGLVETSADVPHGSGQRSAGRFPSHFTVAALTFVMQSVPHVLAGCLEPSCWCDGSTAGVQKMLQVRFVLNGQSGALRW